LQRADTPQNSGTSEPRRAREDLIDGATKPAAFSRAVAAPGDGLPGESSLEGATFPERDQLQEAWQRELGRPTLYSAPRWDERLVAVLDALDASAGRDGAGVKQLLDAIEGQGAIERNPETWKGAQPIFGTEPKSLARVVVFGEFLVKLQRRERRQRAAIDRAERRCAAAGGDLEELHQAIDVERGRAAAGRWFRVRTALSASLPFEAKVKLPSNPRWRRTPRWQIDVNLHPWKARGAKRSNDRPEA
jgi:hypothetical protein